VTQQPNLAELMREASEKLSEAVDKLDAAQLLEQERREKLEGQLRKAVRAFCELGDLITERRAS
jgi:hypothetical protein